MQIDHDLLLLLTGAAIALVSTVIAALVQHILSLREDRIRRERDEQGRRREDLTKIPPSLKLRKRHAELIAAREEPAYSDGLPSIDSEEFMRKRLTIIEELMRERLIEQLESKAKPQDESTQAESPGVETPPVGEEGK